MLPFVNLSNDPEQAYFVEGVTDQIVTDLARFKALFVLSIRSTEKHQEQPADPQRLKQGSASIICWTAAFDAKWAKSDYRLVWSMRSGKIIWSNAAMD